MGWKNAVGAGPVEIPLAKGGARRFESTVAAVPVVAGMCASIGLLQEVGTAQIEAHISAVLDEVAPAASAKGYGVRSGRAAGEGSAILSLRHPSLPSAAVHGTSQEATLPAPSGTTPSALRPTSTPRRPMWPSSSMPCRPEAPFPAGGCPDPFVS